jgi:hypothetical protein
VIHQRESHPEKARVVVLLVEQAEVCPKVHQ